MPHSATFTITITQKSGSIRISQPIFRAVPGFLWVILMGKGSVEARGKRAAFSKPRWARSVRPRGRQLPQGPSVSNKMALTEGSHARCRTGPPRPRTGVEPCHDPVHAESADLCRPNAQFPQERQRYEALTPFMKSGYSQKSSDSEGGLRFVISRSAVRVRASAPMLSIS